MTDGSGGTTSLYYNENGQIAKMVDPLGNPTYYAYDSNFRLTTLTNSLGETASYTYNAAGQITAYTDFMGSTTLYTYGGTNSRLTSTTDPNGNLTGYTYNSSGDLLATNFANGSSSTATYDPEGSATSFLDAGGQTIDVTYNSSGQITQETFSDPTQYTYTYNTHGDLLTATDSTGTTTFTYDPNTDMLTGVAYSNGTYLAFSYNAAGQRTQMVDQSGFVTNYHYDSAGRLSGLTDGSGNIIVTYTYDAAGRLSSKVNGNGTSTTYAYDAAGHILQLINFAADGTTVDSRFDYTYNTLGLPATQTTLDGTWTYTYDGDQRLTHAVFASNNPATTPNQDLAYTYDAAGNRTSTIINGVTTPYTVNNMNQYTNVGGVAYIYDAAGHLTSDGTNTYTYGPTGQLAGITGGAVTASFVYNALGQQITSTSNGQTTQNIVDPGGLGGIVGTLDGSGDVISHMTYGLGLVGAVNGSGTDAADASYYDFDASGSTADITDTGGTVVDQYNYSPFGEVSPVVSNAPNNALYLGQWSATGTITGTGDTIVDFGPVGPYSPQLGSSLLPGIDRQPEGASPETDGAGFWDTLDVIGNAGGVAATINDTAKAFIDEASSAAKLAGDIGEGLTWFGLPLDILGTGNDIYNYFKDPDAVNQEKLGTDVAGLIATETGFGAAYLAANGFAYAAAAEWIALGEAAFVTGVKIGEFLEEHNIDLLPYAYRIENVITNGFNFAYNKIANAVDSLSSLLEKAFAAVVNAFDPNSMIGPSGFGPSNFISATPQALPYQINFENSPSATAPAQQVTITQQLDPNLDWSTFQLSGIGFGDTFINIPAGSQHYQTTVPMTLNGVTFDVQVEAGIHTDTGQVYATFQSIDPGTELPPANPLVGFLPPEDGTGRGDGYVSYSVAQKANLATGTQITSVASVVFDSNNSITTDQVDDEDPSKGTDPGKRALVTIDAGTPTSSVTALPATSPTTSFFVSWSGTDDASGSGIGSYDIYVSDNGGPFTQWLAGTTATSAAYVGAPGHTYSFFSVATDNVGNVEALANTAQASTTISPDAIVQDQLVFTQQPSDAAAGTAVGPAIVLNLQDDLGNPLTGDNSSVTVAIFTGPDGGTLLGTATEQAVNGVATFSDLLLPKSGTYTLLASDGNFTPATSDTFTIDPGAAAKLDIIQQPAFDYLGHPISAPVTVAVEDALGNLVNDNSTITLTIVTAPHNGKVTGTLVAPAQAGLATFNNLSFSLAGTYTLQAADAGLASAITSNIITTLPPAKLVFKQQPTTTIAGQTVAPVTVLVEDAKGHVVPFDNSSVTLTLSSAPAGGTLAGTVSLHAVNGVATFSDLSATVAGSYTLAAADGALTIAKSKKFTINAAGATQLLFLQEPPATLIAGAKINPALTVELKDAFGNVEINDHSKVTLTIFSGPGGALLTGTATAAASKGLAKFSNLSLRTVGTYTLQAADAALTASSTSFNVTPAAAKKLVFTQQPTATMASTPIAPTIVVTVEDTFGNVVTSDSSLITLAIKSGPHSAILSGTLAEAAVNGAATFADIEAPTAGTYTLSAADGRLTSAVSNSFLIS